MCSHVPASARCARLDFCSIELQEDAPPPAATAAEAEAVPAAAAPALFPTVPLPLLELIARHLSLIQRAALFSCCRAVWASEEVAGSALFWGAAGEDEGFRLALERIGRQPPPKKVGPGAGGSYFSGMGHR